jgi:hypothetical protein
LRGDPGNPNPSSPFFYFLFFSFLFFYPATEQQPSLALMPLLGCLLGALLRRV